MNRNQVLPAGARCIVRPALIPAYHGARGVVLFSQLGAGGPGYHDVRLDSGVELLNLYGDELDPEPDHVGPSEPAK